jgi:hypothetical protein
MSMSKISPKNLASAHVWAAGREGTGPKIRTEDDQRSYAGPINLVLLEWLDNLLVSKSTAIL